MFWGVSQWASPPSSPPLTICVFGVFPSNNTTIDSWAMSQCQFFCRMIYTSHTHTGENSCDQTPKKGRDVEINVKAVHVFQDTVYTVRSLIAFRAGRAAGRGTGGQK